MKPRVYKPPFPFVRVEWLDACMYHGWRPISEALEKELDPILTSGYLISRDERLVRVVQSYGTEDNRNEMQDDAVLLIPSAWVTRIRFVKDE